MNVDRLMCYFRGFNAINNNEAITFTQNTLTFKIGFQALLFPPKKCPIPAGFCSGSFILMNEKLKLSELPPPVITRRQDRSSPVSCPVTGQEDSYWKCLLRHQESSCHQETHIILSTGQEDSYHPADRRRSVSCGSP